ncbi:hypothetical protein [Agromyces sp. NPDC056965]|uniref:hypothetical protein n=1 Tax=Agromyces sp. NPDC056965 TaxID=3345983 RepID=UPI003637D1A0
MSNLEDVAAPVVASLIRGEASIDLTPSALQALSEWALAATVVRGEVATDTQSVDSNLAWSFRELGIDNLPVAVGFVQLEWSLDIRATGPVAWSYFHDVAGGVAGQTAIFWFHHVGIVVATQDWAAIAARGFRILSSAVVQAWPSPRASHWPPAGSVADRTLLRVLAIPVDTMPRQSFDFSEMDRGRRTIDAFVVPNVQGTGAIHEAAHEVIARRIAGARQALPDGPSD